MQESQVRSLGQEDPLDENPGFPHSCISSFPLQHSCLANSTDRGDSWATVRGVTQKVRHNSATFSLSPGDPPNPGMKPGDETHYLHWQELSCVCLCDPVDCSLPSSSKQEYWSRLPQIHLFTSKSLVAQTVKKLPAMQETYVWSRGWEDSLEKGTFTHSSLLAWRIPWTEIWWATVHAVTKSWTRLSY